MFREQEHPRDNQGKFTFKNGENSNTSTMENTVEILYGKKSKEEKLQKEKRNELLNKLGDKLRPAQILYSSNEELEKMINKKGVVTGGASNINNKKYYCTTNEKPINYYSISNNKNEISAIGNQHIKQTNNGEFTLENIRKARNFIQGSEGFKDTAYQDIAGVWTIGYGHTGNVDGKPITKNMKISKEKAEELYKKDFENHIAPLKDIKIPLTENQKIALASLIYNVGPGVLAQGKDMRNKLDAGDIKGAADVFDKYIYAKNPKTGKKEPSNGLINRRKREKELFLKPDGE